MSPMSALLLVLSHSCKHTVITRKTLILWFSISEIKHLKLEITGSLMSGYLEEEIWLQQF